MRILLGTLVVLVVLAGFLWLRLDVVASERDNANSRADTATQQLEEQKVQADLLGKRMDALDASIKTLAKRTAENNQKLSKTLTQIDSIQRTENDSEASISCLDTRIPEQLDRSLH